MSRSSIHTPAVILFAYLQGYIGLMLLNKEATMIAMNLFSLGLEAETVRAHGEVVQYFG